MDVVLIILGIAALVAGVGLTAWKRAPSRPRARRDEAPGPGDGEATDGDTPPERERELPMPPEPGPAPPKERLHPPTTRGGAPEPVQFTAYHPQGLHPGQWQKLLVYVHLGTAREAVEADSERSLAGEPRARGSRSAAATRVIPRESTLRIVPELPGCRFNPPEASVLWLEDWHRAEFRVQARRDSDRIGQAVNGRVTVYLHSVLVGEVPIWALISDEDEIAATPVPSPAADPYGRIFVSYSHRDADVVAALGRAYRVLGMEFLQDVKVLRSGEAWNPRLLELIEQADIVQLYWSQAARQSRYVTQEWRHAIEQHRPNFIRPVYWQQPLAPVPDELSHLHFAYLAGLESPAA